MIYQTEPVECGLACIAMILNHFDHKIDLHTLRGRFPISTSGATLPNLLKISDSLDLNSRALKVELEDLDKLSLPCILHWDMVHFVVLKKVKNNKITILDPGKGERTISFDEASKHFTGIALELSPKINFKGKDEHRSVNLSTFWTSIQGLWSSILKLFILSLILQVLLLLAPYYTQTVVDRVILSEDTSLLAVLALGFGIVVVLKAISNALRGWIVLYMTSSLSTQMGSNLFKHLVSLPMDYFEKRHIGDVVSRFESMNQVRELFTSNLVESVIDGLMAILIIAVIFAYSPTLASIVIFVTLIYAVSRFTLYRKLQDRNESAIMAEAKEQSNFMETVRGIQTIKLFGHQMQRFNLWQNLFTEKVNENFKLGQWQVSYQTFNQFLFGIENVLIVYLAARFVMFGDMSVGMLFAFVAYKVQFTDRMTGLIDRLIDVRMVKLHLYRLSDIALTEKEDDGPLYGEKELKGQLAIENLNFRYSSNDPLIFSGLNLEVKQGESVAIVGPSGTGKTTLLKIMLGLLKCTSGKVKIDDQEIFDYGLRPYREQVGTVMQDDQLLSGTIMDNIAFFQDKVDIELAKNSAKIACIRDTIEAMPMKYNSLIGDMGSSLSGGQKQRLLLARALYKKPKILFLDEATSHLDENVESRINSEIASLNITRVIIAHRRETILSADKIIKLYNGRLLDITREFKKAHAEAPGA